MHPITLTLTVLHALVLVSTDVNDNEIVLPRGYHRKVGIPLAKKMRAIEDRIFRNQSDSFRIFQGTKVLPSEHPYYGGLIIEMFHGPQVHESVCGSSLLSPSRVVTAGHCWDDGELKGYSLTVVLGSRHLYYGGLRIRSREVYLHPGWINAAVLRNDIAMIYLPEKLYYFTDNISPIALPYDSELSLTFEGYITTLVGMGPTESDQEFVSPDTSLREAHPLVISQDECRAFYYELVTAGTLCTWKDAMYRTICHGDSGGPLVTYHAGRRILIGIVSYGPKMPCGSNWPSGYTRVTDHMGFIRYHVLDLPI